MIKVFGIGFFRTGTTSLEKALRKLGYRARGGATHPCSKGPDGKWQSFDEMYGPVFKIIDESTTREGRKYNAFTDEPWCHIYKELDERYPGSKFILTVRSLRSWLDSVTSFFDYSPYREFIFGVGNPKDGEGVYAEKYIKHNVEVVDYFSERPNDLLVFHLCDGEGWEPLCKFLDKPIPRSGFPWRNKRGGG